MNKVSYVAERPSPENMHAGSKARIDIDIILEKVGYQNPFNLISKNKVGICNRITYEIDKIKSLIAISKIKGNYLILQYPYYVSKLLRNALYKKALNNKVVLIVHDINSIRDAKNVRQEVEFLNQAHLLIIHNQHMLKKLLSIGVTTQMICLELFDYLVEDQLPKQDYKLSNQIVFAGNLGKSNFLKTKEYGTLDLKFCLYGPNFDPKTMSYANTTYCGSYYPNMIPYKLNGSFGLIWDGDTITECTGLMGEYTRYNNPHKLSMYIAAGIPVIVWKEAAIASFVEDNNIGFTVNKLTEIESYLESLDNYKYNTLLQNTRILQEKVCTGYYTMSALQKMEELLFR